MAPMVWQAEPYGAKELLANPTNNNIKIKKNTVASWSFNPLEILNFVEARQIANSGLIIREEQ